MLHYFKLVSEGDKVEFLGQSTYLLHQLNLYPTSTHIRLSNIFTMFVEGPPSPGFASPHGHATGDTNHKGFTPRSRQNSGVFNRDDNNAMMRSLHNGRRPPQRSRTTHEHIPAGPQVLTLTMMTPHHSRPHTPAPVPAVELSPAVPVKGRDAQSASLPMAKEQPSESADTVTALQPLSSSQQRRPKMGKPRRSYSVMDYEPVLPWQRPASGALAFSTLPVEMHMAFFDFLDPIDATCLGLTNRYMYAIHRRMHGAVPLSSRRHGPNELEWAWHRAAYPSLSASSSLAPLTPCKADDNSRATANANGPLAALRVRGKGLCRKCGISRCELHKHIREWMPAEYEYCSVRDRFVPVPSSEQKKSCYMSNPTNSNRCGRHRVKRREGGSSSTPTAAA